jgi:hypothetical protein
LQPLSQEDYAITYKTLKGARSVMIPQHRTIYELEQAVAAGELKTPFDPFPFAVVQASRLSPRDPVAMDRQRPMKNIVDWFMPAVPTYTVNVNGQSIVKARKWCSECDQWQKQEAFSVDKRNRDGLHTYCKSCRADKARVQYWEMKLAS